MSINVSRALYLFADKINDYVHHHVHDYVHPHVHPRDEHSNSSGHSNDNNMMNIFELIAINGLIISFSHHFLFHSFIISSNPALIIFF